MLCYPCHYNSPSFKSHTVNINASCLQLFLETWLSAFLKGTVVLADAVFMGLELVTGNISISSPQLLHITKNPRLMKSTTWHYQHDALTQANLHDQLAQMICVEVFCSLTRVPHDHTDSYWNDEANNGQK